MLVSASTASLVESELTDLGEHRFKDLGAPDRVYQLGGDTFPALKSLYRMNLPVPATAFRPARLQLADGSRRRGVRRRQSFARVVSESRYETIASHLHAYSLGLSPDGRTLAASDGDRVTLTLFDLKSGRLGG